MSKRHQASHRRSCGRRLHDLRDVRTGRFAVEFVD